MPVFVTAALTALLAIIGLVGHLNTLLSMPTNLEVGEMSMLYHGIVINGILAALASLTVWSWMNWRPPVTSRIAALFVIALFLTWLSRLAFSGLTGELQTAVSVVWLAWLLYLLALVVPSMVLGKDATESSPR